MPDRRVRVHTDIFIQRRLTMRDYYCVLARQRVSNGTQDYISGPFSTRRGAERAAVALLTAGAMRAQIFDAEQIEAMAGKGYADWHSVGGAASAIVQANPRTQRDSVARAARNGDPVAKMALADLEQES